jgi:hypothetical protein
MAVTEADVAKNRELKAEMQRLAARIDNFNQNKSNPKAPQNPGGPLTPEELMRVAEYLAADYRRKSRALEEETNKTLQEIATRDGYSGFERFSVGDFSGFDL